MWTQNGHAPPHDLYSAFFPWRGAYSSSDPNLVDRQMAEIAAAGVDEVVVSWWGWGSPTDRRLPSVIRAAQKYHLTVAVHIEPFEDRTAAAVAGDVKHLAELGITDVYVFDPMKVTAAEWAAVRPTMPPVRLFAQTGSVGFAAAAGFDGIYTYDIVTYTGDKFIRLCTQAHAAHLLCAPSVGPGYDAVPDVCGGEVTFGTQVTSRVTSLPDVAWAPESSTRWAVPGAGAACRARRTRR